MDGCDLQMAARITKQREGQDAKVGLPVRIGGHVEVCLEDGQRSVE